MSQDKTLDDLFLATLKDIYFAEKQILKALPRLAKAAADPQLKAGFEAHHDETEGHIDRLEQIFEMLGAPARAKTCDAILGILEESKDITDEFKGSPALDAGLIASARAVEHYEMARYGMLRTWAHLLGRRDAAQLLDATYKEEAATDQKLAGLASNGDTAKAA